MTVLVAGGLLWVYSGIAPLREASGSAVWFLLACAALGLSHLICAALVWRGWRYQWWLSHALGLGSLAGAVCLTMKKSATLWLLLPAVVIMLVAPWLRRREAAPVEPDNAIETDKPKSTDDQTVPVVADRLLVASALSLLIIIVVANGFGMRDEPVLELLFLPWGPVALLVLIAVVAKVTEMCQLRLGLAIFLGVLTGLCILGWLTGIRLRDIEDRLVPGCFIVVPLHLLGWGRGAASTPSPNVRRWLVRASAALVLLGAVLWAVSTAALTYSLAVPAKLEPPAAPDPVITQGKWVLIQDGGRFDAFVWFEGKEYRMFAGDLNRRRIGRFYAPWRTKQAPRTVAVVKKADGSYALIRRRGAVDAACSSPCTPAPKGDKFIFYRAGKGLSWKLRPNGEINESGRLGGATWRGEALELILEPTKGPLKVFRFEALGKRVERPLEQRCESGQRFEFAYLAKEGWTIVCTRLAEQRGADGSLIALEVTVDEIGSTGSKQRSKVRTEGPFRTPAEKEPHVFVVKARGNIFQPLPEARHAFVALWKRAGKWQRIVGPDEDRKCSPEFNYVLRNSQLEPRLTCIGQRENQHLIGERWIRARQGATPLPNGRGGHWQIGGAWYAKLVALQNPNTLRPKGKLSLIKWMLEWGFIITPVWVPLVGWLAMLLAFPIGLTACAVVWRRSRDQPRAIPWRALRALSSYYFAVWLIWAESFFVFLKRI